MLKKVLMVCAVVVLVFAPLALAQGYEPPNTTEIPGWVLTVIGFFSSKWVLPVAFAGIVIGAVQVLRVLIASFGSHLGDKGIYLAGLLMSFLTVFGEAASDGSIAGEEWVSVIVALATFLAAVAGYKLLFSAAAKAKLHP